MYLAVKDDNIPGKVCLGGGNVEQNAELCQQILQALQKFKGEKATAVAQTKDDYDKTFGVCYKNSQLTTGAAAFSFSKPYFPHGYVLESLLLILHSAGWKAIGGPNFGDDGNTWPSIIFKSNNNNNNNNNTGNV